MKISIDDLMGLKKNERFKWFILELAAKDGNKFWVPDVLKGGDRDLEIKLTINGVEMDPNEPINTVVEALEEHISSRAQKLIEEKFSELSNKLGNLRNKCDELEEDLKFEAVVGRKRFYEDG